jgi:hypothetical protein
MAQKPETGWRKPDKSQGGRREETAKHQIPSKPDKPSKVQKDE